VTLPLVGELRGRRDVARAVLHVPWPAWSDAFVARRAVAVAGGAAPAMVLAVPAAPSFRTLVQRTAVTLAPRVRLALTSVVTGGDRAAALSLPDARAHADHTPSEAAAALHGPAPPFDVLPTAGPVSRASTAWTIGPIAWLARETIRRVVDERARVELPLVRGDAAGNRAERRVPAAGVAAFRRSVTELEHAPERSLHVSPAPAPPEPSVPGVAMRAAEAPAAAQQVDLEHLTDEVVRQIDRRIVAHRERVGRI
jgi:hypothetical protein